METIMKKIYSILAAIIVLASCTAEEMISTGDKVCEGKVQVGITVSTADPQAAETKALGNSADIRSLKVAVFDGNGVYVEQIDATLDKAQKKWFATLSLSSSKRRIHLLANYSGDIPRGLGELELAKISTSEDMYWQMVELDDITASVTGDNPPKLTLNNPERLQGIKLVRNFAKISVSSDVANSKLVIISAGLYNTPDKGSIVPYSVSNGAIMTSYLSHAKPDNLISAGYAGYEAIGSSLASSSGFTDKIDDKVTLFSFEREKPLADAPFVIVKGYYNGSATPTYYRLNLRLNDKEYFPILRNFEYQVKIKSVDGKGASSIAEAIASAGSGDISTDLRYLSLTDISNGEARIFASHTEMMLVSSDEVKVKYTFIPDMNHPTTTANAAVSVTLGEASALGAVFKSFSKGGTTDSEGYTTVTLVPNEPDDVPKKQILFLVGTYTDTFGNERTITREVAFTLREKQGLRLKVLNGGIPTSVVAATKETPFDLEIGIPDGLPEAIFPLDLAIEARNLSISPRTDAGTSLPTATEMSYFNPTVPAFQFIKTVTYSEYDATAADSDGYLSFKTGFKTNVAASATDIAVVNEYFNPGVTYFTNGEAKRYRFDFFKLVSMSGGRSQLEFNMPTVTPVTLTLKNLVPSGKNADRMTLVSPGVYTYTPAQAGMQEIGLTFGNAADPFYAQASATDYDSSAYGDRFWSISRPVDWYTKSDYTVGSQAVVPGFTTTVTADVRTNSTERRKVIFTINGKDFQGRCIADNDIDGISTWGVDYTVPSDFVSLDGKIDVDVTVSDKTGSYNQTDFGQIDSWKTSITIGGVRIEKAADLNSASVGKTDHPSESKKIWKGFVLQNCASNSYYMYNDNGTLSAKNSGLTTDVGFCFTSDGSTYLKTFTDKYVNIIGTTEGSGDSRYNLKDTDQQSVAVTFYNKRFTIAKKNYYRWVLEYYNGDFQLHERTDAQVTGNNDYGCKWNAYPVTIEFIPY